MTQRVSVVPGGATFGTDVFSQNGTDNFAMVVLKDMGSVIFSGLAVPFAEFTNVLTGSINCYRLILEGSRHRDLLRKT